MSYKSLLFGLALILVIGIGGFLYRNAIERGPIQTSACTLEAKVCPDGSSVGRIAPDCNFAQCPAPNITLAGVIFLPPALYASSTPPAGALADFALPPVSASSSPGHEIVMRSYSLPSGSTGADVFHSTALGDASGVPVSPSAFSAVTLGNYTFTTVVLGRYEGVIHVAYYLPRQSDVLRFESIDRGVANWTDPSLDVTGLRANQDLRAMLTTLENN